MHAYPIFLVLLSLIQLKNSPVTPYSVAGHQRYVKQDAVGVGDGSSWANAFNDLQDALAAAEPGDTIWVAEGVYHPGNDGDRTHSFALVDGIHLYGGFSGTENSLSERDISAHPTLLSGDIGLPGDATDNAYHILVGDNLQEPLTMDGFIIQGAYSGDQQEDEFGHGFGGGLSLRNVRLRLINCHFQDNVAVLGAGIGFQGEKNHLELVNCTFENNYAVKEGGGFYFQSSVEDHCVVQHTDFIANRSGGRGTAFFVPFAPDITFQNNTFVGNQGLGAATEDCVFSGDFKAVFRDCLFENNSGVFRLYTPRQWGRQEFYNCQFLNHTESRLLLSNRNSLFYSCLFKNNRVPIAYDGMFYNCLFSQNSEHFRAANLISFVNCTFWNWKGRIFNGVFGNYHTIKNTIFWQPEGATGDIFGGGLRPTAISGIFEFSNCILSQNLCGVTVGGGAASIICDQVLVGHDPHFINPAEDDFSVHYCSPALNSGDNAALAGLPATDIWGNERIQGGVVDIGAVETNRNALETTIPTTVVTKLTDDHTPNTLRSAFVCANTNPGPDTIRFEIDGGRLPFIIQLESPLPALVDSQTVIDVTLTQEPGAVIVDGSGAPGAHLLKIAGHQTEIYGLTLQNSSGDLLVVEADSCTIGRPGKGNTFFGCAPAFSNVVITGVGNKIQSNRIGAPFPDASTPLPGTGISVGKNNLIGGNRTLGEGNVIGSLERGINLQGAARIAGNFMGTDSLGTAHWGNEVGIWVATEVAGALIGGGEEPYGNRFAHNQIAIRQPDAVHAIQVEISKNSFYCHDQAIVRENAGVQVVIDTACLCSVNGSAPPRRRIALYRLGEQDCGGDTACQGAVFVGETQTDTLGRWTFSDLEHTLDVGDWLTALATSPEGHTGKFSACRIVDKYDYYETTPDTFYVKPDATGNNDGSSWDNAFTSLFRGLAAANAADEIWVAEGVYFPYPDYGQESTFRIRNGIKLFGGFAGQETSCVLRDWREHPTILSGNIGAPQDSLDNLFNVVTLIDTDSTTWLDGLFIESGLAANGSAGGVLIAEGDDEATATAPLVQHCVIRRHVAGAGLLNC